MKKAPPCEWFGAELLDAERLGSLVGPSLERLHGAHRGGRAPQQLLLVGPTGLGRELVAAELAAILTCPVNGPLWCDCRSCDRARRGVHPDVERVAILEGKKQIIVDQIRHRVVELVAGRPFEGVRRVWVFDGVEAGRLGLEAANAFLKTLEEPPDHAAFVLLAANPARVLATIRSRCQTMVLPGPVAVAGWLGSADLPPELAPAVAAGEEVEALVLRARSVLAAGGHGSLRQLLHLSQVVRKDPRGVEVVASVALELAASQDDADAAEDLVRLAADLLAADWLAQALNLRAKRHVLSCLLRWRSGLLGTGVGG